MYGYIFFRKDASGLVKYLAPHVSHGVTYVRSEVIPVRVDIFYVLHMGNCGWEHEIVEMD